MDEYLYVTDCEGPVTKNDNAYEITDFFLGEGGKLFSLLSVFDDYLGLFGGIENYRYGSTLRYIVPFLKAAGVTDESLRDYSRKTLIITPGIKEALNTIKKEMAVYVISTSYQHYIDEVTKYLDIEPQNVFCTKMSLDIYELKPEEKLIIEESREKIKELPSIKWDEKGNLIGDASQTVRFLKELFFDILPRFPIGGFLDSIIPIGGKEKAKILMEIVEKKGISYKNTIYVGDSITDTEAFEFLREKGGLTISFNGNRYAVQKAEYVVVSDSALVLSEIVQRYKAFGRDGIKSIKTEKNTLITERHDSEVVEASEKMRRALRGEAIGQLG